MDEQTTGFIIGLIAGLLVGGCGVYLLATGDPRLLHRYHYAGVRPANMPALARWSGAGLAVCGVGCVLIVPLPGLPDWLSVAGIVLIVAGIALALGAIVRFNGSLFAFAAAGDDAVPPDGSARALAMSLGVLIAAICCAVTVVPGALMVASGDPSALHGYHLANVAPESYPALARWEGAGMIVMGCGLATGVVGSLLASRRRPSPLWTKALAAAGAVAFALGLAVMLGAIIHFNGSLMG